MPQVWVPGAAGPLEEFVDRLYRRIDDFAQRHGVEQALVEVELGDGSLFAVQTISAEPGFGFVTIAPHPDDDPGGTPIQELIVPIGSIRQITLSRPEPARAQLGFSPPRA